MIIEKEVFHTVRAKLWKSLPLELWQATSLSDFTTNLSLHSFKKKMKHSLQEKQPLLKFKFIFL